MQEVTDSSSVVPTTEPCILRRSLGQDRYVGFLHIKRIWRISFFWSPLIRHGKPCHLPPEWGRLQNHFFADMAKLADALDLGSNGQPCRFKSCYPHQKNGKAFALPVLLVNIVEITGLEGGGDCGSNRFAGELFDCKKVCRKLNSPAGCSPGRAAKGASPVIRTKRKRGTRPFFFW